MNNDHDLFEDGPDLTPTPAPGPATSGPGSDDDNATKTTPTAPPSMRSPLQQEFLAEQRHALHGLAQAERDLLMEFQSKWKDNRALSAPILARVINKTHCGSWDDLWVLVDSLDLMNHDDGYPFVFVLSGWCSSPEDLAIPPVAPSLLLLEKLKANGIYGRAAALATAYIAKPTDDNAADELWTWVRAWRAYFTEADLDGFWSTDRVKEVADAKLAAQTLDLQSEFLFLEHRLFWFTSSATAVAWPDFYYFALGYHYLPDKFKADLGPYSLTISTAPSATP